jgi:transposase InsO family protein
VDRPHAEHRPQTTRTPAQEAIVVELRKTLLLSLDGLLTVIREFINPDVSRSGLDRCLRRHSLRNLRTLRPEASMPAHYPFAANKPEFVHIDLKYLPPMTGEFSLRYLFVAIDRATRWVFVQVKPAKTARKVRAFLAALIRACPTRIHIILTDNGKAFTNRFVTTAERMPSGQHVFDALCATLGIKHRLTRVHRHQTNEMMERFNDSIEEVR